MHYSIQIPEHFVLMSLENSQILAEGVAVDWVNDRVYFTDSVLDIIGIYDLTMASSNYSVLIETGSGSTPRSIVVDPSAE